MDSHITKGFNPLSGQEIKKAVCGSLLQELDRHDFLSQNLAYPVVRWKIHVEIELGASAPSTVPENVEVTDRFPVAASGAYQQTDQEGKSIEHSRMDIRNVETAHVSQFPDVTRGEFIEGAPAPSPDSANVAVAPTKAGVESFPEKFRRTRK